jgi:hypothetical protein
LKFRPLAPYPISINLLSGKRFKKSLSQKICDWLENTALLASYLITAATIGFSFGFVLSVAPIPTGLIFALVSWLN